MLFSYPVEGFARARLSASMSVRTRLADSKSLWGVKARARRRSRATGATTGEADGVDSSTPDVDAQITPGDMIMLPQFLAMMFRRSHAKTSGEPRHLRFDKHKR